MKVGDKVVCTREYWNDAKGQPQPKKDEIYIISKVYDSNEVINSLPKEVYLGFNEFPYEAWLSCHFRPLDYSFVESVIEMVREDVIV